MVTPPALCFTHGKKYLLGLDPLLAEPPVIQYPR
jgi:hypothetical protein